MKILDALHQAFIDRLDVWSQLAVKIGALYHGNLPDYGLFRRANAVRLEVGEWTISLEQYKNRYGEVVLMRAPYQDKNGFRFLIARKNIVFKIARLFGMQDVNTGYAVFDDEFIIKTNDEEMVRSFLDNPKLRQLIRSQPSLSLEIRKSKVLENDTLFNHGVELYTPGPYDKDINTLISAFEMFGEALRQLRRIGSA